MENSTKALTGIILLLLASLGFSNVPETATHICYDNKAAYECLDMSSTSKTCYTLPGKTGGKRCSSLWIPIDSLEVSKNDSVLNVNYHCYPEKGYCRLNGLLTNPKVPIT